MVLQLFSLQRRSQVHIKGRWKYELHDAIVSISKSLVQFWQNSPLGRANKTEEAVWAKKLICTIWIKRFHQFLLLLLQKFSVTSVKQAPPPPSVMGWAGTGLTFGRVGHEAKGQASSVVGINTAVTRGKCSICLMCHFRSGTHVILQTWQPHGVYHPSGIWSELKLFTNVWSLTFIESGL